jgi:long-chain acyl-CoA synthetase
MESDDIDTSAPAQTASVASAGTRETLDGLLDGLRAKGARPAIVQIRDSSSEVISYDELAGAIDRCAAAIERFRVGSGDCVALLAAGGPRWIISCLGVLRTHAVAVPLDTQLDIDSLRHILDHCSARCMLTDGDGAKKLAAIGFRGHLVRIDEPWEGQDTESEPRTGEGNQVSRASADDTALLFYTSGTTGEPKGVPLTHRNLTHQLAAIAAAGLVAANDRVLQPLPPHHVYPLVVGTLAPLALGVTIVIPDAMTGPRILTALDRGEVTFVIGVPRLYAALLAGIDRRLKEQPGLGAAAMRRMRRLSVWLRRKLGLRWGRFLLRPLHRRLAPRLRVLASGGAALDAELAMQLEGLGWRVGVGYGLTETAPLLTINPPGNGHLDSVGRPIPGVELKIDYSAVPSDETDVGELRAPASNGEILARGPSVFRGYLLGDGAPAGDDVFTPDGWFRTGDLGALDERGYLTITGRKSTLIVTSAGKNIQPDELEERYAQHPYIEEIGICAYGDGLGAVVVPSADAPRGEANAVRRAIRDALAEYGSDMASYKRITKHVISTQPLPRTRLGKIRRHRLELLMDELSRRKGRESPAKDARDRAVDTENEALLGTREARAVWDLISRRYRDQDVTLDTSLQLDLGLDSLGWLELGAEMGENLGVTLDEQQIAEIDTVRDLIEHVGRPGSTTAGSVSPIASPAEFLGAEQMRRLEPLPPSAAWLGRAMHGLNRLLASGLFGLRVYGTEGLPRDGQLLIAPNHTSFLDPFAIAAALPPTVLRRVFWAGWTGYAFRNAFFRAVSRLGRVVPIDPERAAGSSLAFAAAIMQRGDHLVWFPEGERSTTNEIVPLKPGLGLLLQQFPDVLVVPTRIDGAFEAWPRNRKWPRLRSISVTFGAPLRGDELAANGAGEPLNVRILSGLEAALREMRAMSMGGH